MKNILLLSVLCFGISTGYAQKVKAKNVPQNVKEAFQKNFPNAKVEKWQKEEGNFEAEFDFNKTENSALIDANGNLLETETEIPAKDLPQGVSIYLAKYEAGNKIKEASRITDSKGSVTFEAECGEAEYIFDSLGNFVRKDLRKGEKEDDEKEKK